CGLQAAADAAARPGSRAESPRRRLEPVARLETASLLPDKWMPGHGYDILAWSIGPNFFRGLLRLDRDVNVVPDLAERITVSADMWLDWFQFCDEIRWV